MLDRTQPPIHYPVTGFDLFKPVHITFANGLKVFVFDSGDQELVRIEWIFGNVFSDERHALLNTCACEMLLEGTTTRTSAQVAEEVDFYGAFLFPTIGYDQSALTLFSLNKHLGKLLPLVKDLLTDSAYPEKELATYIRNNKQKLQVSLKKNSFVARRQFNRAVFGPSRYGYVPDAEDYDGITRDALLALYRKQYQPSNGTLIVAGKVTPDLLGMLESLFGNEWPGNEIPVPPDVPPVFSASSGSLTVDERADALQSAIQLGYQTIQRSHRDFPGLQVLNTLLGGYFGSRLMANIREEKGYTYNIGSGLASLKHGAFFTVSSEVGVEVTAATLTEIEREIKLLRDSAVSEAELTVVRNYMMGSMLGSLENVFSHADKFKNAYFSGLDLGYYEYYTDIVNTVTPAEIQRLANEYLDYDRMVKVVVGRLK